VNDVKISLRWIFPSVVTCEFKTARTVEDKRCDLMPDGWNTLYLHTNMLTGCLVFVGV